MRDKEEEKNITRTDEDCVLRSANANSSDYKLLTIKKGVLYMLYVCWQFCFSHYIITKQLNLAFSAFPTGLFFGVACFFKMVISSNNHHCRRIVCVCALCIKQLVLQSEKP